MSGNIKSKFRNIRSNINSTFYGALFGIGFNATALVFIEIKLYPIKSEFYKIFNKNKPQVQVVETINYQTSVSLQRFLLLTWYESIYRKSLNFYENENKFKILNKIYSMKFKI